MSGAHDLDISIKSTAYIRQQCYSVSSLDIADATGAVKDLGESPACPSSTRLATLALGECTLSIIDCHRDPLFVVDSRGQLVYCNTAGKAVLRAKAGFAVRQGKLLLDAKPVDALLQRIMPARRQAGSAGAHCRGVRFPRSNGSRDWLVLVRSLGTCGDTEYAGAYLLHAVARTTPRSLPAQVLKDLFGLTNRETVVLTELARSGTVRAAAHRLALSTETIRSHVKKTFQKCDVHSRAELVALLQGVTEFTSE